ncbi:MAG: NAD-dependent epimerase/dehydratase family protein [Chitinophagaceae bacterium]|nr:NAD-dependent epimerase/dehydratase family protein [Bacteroidota bacterium]MCC6257837.1 NAD-dependent epimerase/dehydratase family protein [Chitinophagaceae bacterium]MCW5917464.1 NAD-dependent epimerase/dehydratase family protein [Ferruginibacter sp.]
MKIAVTGATGHIGYTLCKSLIHQGHEVSALVYADFATLNNLSVKKITGDVTDRESLKGFLENADIVLHTAAAIELGYRFNKKLYDVNVTGTKNILELAKEAGVKKVIHFSSIHAFSQRPYHIPLDETRELVSGRSIFYDQTKRESLLLALDAAKNGQWVVVICPTSVVGPEDHKPSKLGKAIIDIYRGAVPAIIKGGFDFVDVRDLVSGTIAAMEKGRSGEVYLLGGKYYTIKQFADLVLKIKGAKKELAEIPLALAYAGLPFIKLYAFLTGKRPLYDKPYIDILQDGNKDILSTKAQKELGYIVRPLEETMADTIEWFKKSGQL